MPDPPQHAARARAARAPADGRLKVVLTDDRGKPAAAPGLAAWLRRVAPARAKGIVNVALVSSGRIRALNREFRRKDRVTDVLSFPPAPNPGSAARSDFLGDIAVARPVAKRQARSAGHDELTELKILVLHGLLHLLGYDHERDHGLMLRTERRLRRKGGLREGLIERAG